MVLVVDIPSFVFESMFRNYLPGSRSLRLVSSSIKTQSATLDNLESESIVLHVRRLG